MTVQQLTQDYLTEDEAAAMLKVSKRSLQRWRMQGNGAPFIKLHAGRSPVLYAKADLVAWLNERKYHSTSEYQDVRTG